MEDLRKEGLSLLFITHNLALVNSIADHVIVLERGRLERGTTRNVIQKPAALYTRELLAAAPEIGAYETHD